MDERVFGIGLNKTGTTSLKRCYEALGLVPVAPTQGPRAREIIRAVVRDNDYEPALRLARDYRAFEDRPWNVWDMYRHADERFPGSRFILTVRDPDSWWRSVKRWVKVTKPQMKPLYRVHFRVKQLKRREMIESYQRYNQEVADYFRGRSDFLLLEIEKADWETVCGFLGQPVPDLPFPHTNRQRYDESDVGRFGRSRRRQAPSGT